MDLVIVFIILAAALVLFTTEVIAVDLTAILILAALVATGVLTAQEGVAGFSNPAPITVAAVLVLSAGLIKTGAVVRLGSRLSRLGGSGEIGQMTVVLLTVGVLSAFINNTAAVAMFIPMVVGLAKDRHISPSKLLMPMSFAGILGGLCTYIGTSTNIIVGSILEEHGYAPFRMFEFSRLGILLLAFGVVYLLVLGRKLLPARRTEDALTDDYRLRDYLTELVVRPNSRLIGKTLKQSNLSTAQDVEVLDIRRAGHRLSSILLDIKLAAGDVLIVKGNIENILRTREIEGLDIHPEVKLGDQDLKSADVGLAEGVISPRSSLVGKTLVEADFRKRFQATVLAIRRHGGQIREKLGRVVLHVGDTLLIQGRRDRLQSLKESPDFLLIMEDLPTPRYRKRKMTAAVLIFLTVIVVAALNVMPIMVAAVLGAVAMIVTRCLTIQEAYAAIDWRIIMLIAGTLSLGKALEKTGGATLIAERLIDLVGPHGPVAVLAALFLLTVLMTEMMSNSATAALLTPIALSIGHTLEADPRPFAVCVAFAASASFLSPIGYQTNTLVYGPGGYRFTDYARVGLPITLVTWLLATLLIPAFWPFEASQVP
ncbi:MAG: SLC13 family permease [Acidobacteria bacterium]|nr:MAG: SLC13 family permease [Acidobacteriota bacterium]